MKKINLEEILKSKFTFTDAMEKQMALQAMKEACKQALELAAENATTKEKTIEYRGYGNITEYGKKIIINKQSILNTINQIN